MASGLNPATPALQSINLLTDHLQFEDIARRVNRRPSLLTAALLDGELPALPAPIATIAGQPVYDPLVIDVWIESIPKWAAELPARRAAAEREADARRARAAATPPNAWPDPVSESRRVRNSFPPGFVRGR